MDRDALVMRLGWLVQAYQRSSAGFDDAVARRLGLNHADLRGLDWLADQPRSARELAEGTGLSTTAVTALIDRLEHKGYVARSRSSDDRRKVVVELTQEGRRRVEEAYGPLVAEGGALFDGVPTRTLEAMARVLEDMREVTDRHRDRLRSE